jgi:DNA-binding XRE family transcriptional regulator
VALSHKPIALGNLPSLQRCMLLHTRQLVALSHERGDNHAPVTAGELLRDARRRHGLTQRQLAARARTSQAAISRIERGVVSPSVDTLAELLWLMNERLELGTQTVNWGFDLTLNEPKLALPVETRIRQQAAFARGLRRFQDAIRS